MIFLMFAVLATRSSSLVESTSHGFLLDWRRMAAGAAGATMCWILCGKLPGLCGSVGKRRAGRKESFFGRLDCCCCCCWDCEG